MEQRLNASADAASLSGLTTTTTTPPPLSSRKMSASATTAAQEDKDQLIRDLESEVEQQRQLRMADAKQVEAKAARIKDWVTNKLRELEEQNQHLRAQNAHCNDQMDLLKNRLEQLQAINVANNAAGSSTTNTAKTKRSSVAEVSRFFSISNCYLA